MPDVLRGVAAMIATAVLVGCGGGVEAEHADSRPRETAESSGSQGPPRRLEIPRLDVDSRVLALGTAPDGAQEVPDGIDEVAWWREGAEPGEDGNAVLVGHTASRGDGVFDRLGTLRRGDHLTIQSRGGALAYSVTDTSEVEVEEFATVAESIYRQTGPSGLVLMTCGDWNGHDYDTTVVVHADLDR